MQHHIKPVAAKLGFPLKGYHTLRHYAEYRNMPNAPAISARYAYLQVPDSA